MIRNPRLKARIKNFLIGVNIFLGTALLSIIIYWVFVMYPRHIEYAKQLNHYIVYSMDNLPRARTITSYDEIDKEDIDLHEEFFKKDDFLKVQNNLDDDLDMEFSNTDKLLESVKHILSKDDDFQEVKGNSVNKPKISIIVANLGLDRQATKLALTLDKECTLGFSSYHDSLKDILNDAKDYGHEVLLHLPIRGNIKSGSIGDHNILSADGWLNLQSRYNGFYLNPMEDFTENIELMNNLFDILDHENLTFVLNKEISDSIPPYIKDNNNIFNTDIIIDHNLEKKYISEQLKALVRVAKENGSAVGYTQGFVLTINLIKDWIETLEKQGVKLVPLSELTKESIA